MIISVLHFWNFVSYIQVCLCCVHCCVKANWKEKRFVLSIHTYTHTQNLKGVMMVAVQVSWKQFYFISISGMKLVGQHSKSHLVAQKLLWSFPLLLWWWFSWCQKTLNQPLIKNILKLSFKNGSESSEFPPWTTKSCFQSGSILKKQKYRNDPSRHLSAN